MLGATQCGPAGTPGILSLRPAHSSSLSGQSAAQAPQPQHRPVQLSSPLPSVQKTAVLADVVLSILKVHPQDGLMMSQDLQFAASHRNPATMEAQSLAGGRQSWAASSGAILASPT